VRGNIKLTNKPIHTLLFPPSHQTMCKKKNTNKENHLEDSDIFATDLKTPLSDVEENPTARLYKCEFAYYKTTHKKLRNLTSVHYISPLIIPIGIVFYIIFIVDLSPLQRGTA